MWVKNGQKTILANIIQIQNGVAVKEILFFKVLILLSFTFKMPFLFVRTIFFHRVMNA